MGNLISQSFSQVLDERLGQSGTVLTPEIKALLNDIFSEQENFNKVRTVEKASIKLCFRIVTEVKSEGNLLNETKYPEILDNTLNFVLPFPTEADRDLALQKMGAVFSTAEIENFREIKLKHHFNGQGFLIKMKNVENPKFTTPSP